MSAFCINYSVTTVQASSKMSVSTIKTKIKKRYKTKYIKAVKVTAKKIKKKNYNYKVIVKYAQGDGALRDVYYVNSKTGKAKFYSMFGDEEILNLKKKLKKVQT